MRLGAVVLLPAVTAALLLGGSAHADATCVPTPDGRQFCVDVTAGQQGDAYCVQVSDLTTQCYTPPVLPPNPLGHHQICVGFAKEGGGSDGVCVQT